MHTLIICTKNRKKEILNLIDDLRGLYPKFDQIIIIDSSIKENRIVHNFDFGNILINYLDVGLSDARNIGLSMVNDEAKFVHFLDDDVSLKSDYLLQVNIFFNNYPDAHGVTGNDLKLTSKKNVKIFLLKYYLLLSRKQGKFTRFGFNYGNYFNFGTYLVDWLPGCNMVFKFEIANKYLFKKSFNPTFCEDLVYGLDISVNHKLYYCSKIKYEHHLSPLNRLSRSSKRLPLYNNLNYLLEYYPSYLNKFAVKLRTLYLKFLINIT